MKPKRKMIREPSNTIVSPQEILMNRLTDRWRTAAYLNAAARSRNLKSLLKALRDVVDAQGGVSEASRKAGLCRTTLYKSLSPNGNPELETLDALLAVYGVRIAFSPIPQTRAISPWPAAGYETQDRAR